MKRYIMICAAILLGFVCAQAESINVDDVTMNPGQTKTVAISLTNSHTNIVSFQMDLYLPDDVTVNKNGCSLSSRFGSSYELTIGKQSDGVYRLTATSFSLTPISGSSGTIINLSLTAGSTTMDQSATIKNIRFVTSDSERIIVNNTSFRITIGSFQTMSLTSIPSMTYGDIYTLPSTTNQNLILTWTVSDTSIASVSGNVLTAEGVGTTTITANQVGNNSYIPFSRQYSLNVYKSSLTITAQSYTIEYGSSLPAFEATYTGFKNNDNASSLTTQPSFSCTATSSSAPGTYDINVSGAEANNYTISYVKGTLTINAKNASNLTISSIAAQTYTGSAITPTVTVKDGSTTLTSGTDYTVAYSNNTNAGTATVTVTGKGYYTGTKTATFTINARSASNFTISSIAAQTYTGSAITPTVTVKDGSTTLTSGTDYTVAYSNNTNAGTATVTVTGKGNYTGTKNATFTINAKSASSLTISSIAAQTYTGSALTPTVTVKDGTTTLTSGTDYTVTYSDNTNVGTATVTVTGKGNYTGTKTATFTINAKAASNLTISSIAAQTYTGSALTPAVTVKDGSTTLTSGTDYTVAYSNNTNAGTATVTVTGKGNYTGTKTATFTINAKAASNFTISEIAAVTYNGSAQTPTVTVKDGTTTLASGTDYTAAYSNNTNAGTATVTVTGKGNYTGTKTATFVINAKNASNLTISSIAAQTYTGSALTPAVTVKDGSTTLTSGTDYTVAYSDNTNVGTATVTVTGKGNYTGTKTTTFIIFKVITFADSHVKDICVTNWDTNGDNELSETEAAAVTDLGTVFKAQSNITSFNELQYFTGLTSIGSNAFSGCSGLTSVTIPNSVTSIGFFAFSGCSGLTSVTIPNNVTSIGNEAFYGCSGLTSIEVESGNTKYDSRSNCNAIIESATNTLICGCKNTTIPNSVTSIGYEAFYGCSGLTSVTIPNSVTSIGYEAFYGCSGLTSVTIPNSVTSIGTAAFASCSSLTSVTIPNRVTRIGTGAFSDCTDLTSITIPNSITSIGNYAFQGCSSLTSVTIPNRVTSIGSSAFNGCSKLTSVITEKETPISIGSDVFSNRANAKLYVPKGTKSAYAAANYWTEFKAIKEFPDGDVNEDGETDVVDVVDIARTVIEELTGDVIMHLADLNNSNSVTVADAIVLINDIAGDTNWAKPMMARSRATANDVLKLVSSDGNNLSLQMDGNGQYAAFQFDLWLPENVDIMEMTLNNERRQGHQLLYNKVGDGHYRVVALSTAANSFSGTSGELLDMTLDDFATDDIRVDDIRFVTPDGGERQFDALSVTRNGITTSIDSLNGDDNCDKHAIYNLNGQRMNTSQRGLNIINGRKVVIK